MFPNVQNAEITCRVFSKCLLCKMPKGYNSRLVGSRGAHWAYTFAHLPNTIDDDISIESEFIF